ncbi:MAG: DUF4259 domain-containing protein [bacterium]
MGVWGTRAFDNDEALDWVDSINVHGVSLIPQTLFKSEYSNYQKVAAIAILAILKNPDLIEELDYGGAIEDSLQKFSVEQKEYLSKIDIGNVNVVIDTIIDEETEKIHSWREEKDGREWVNNIRSLKKQLEQGCF